MRNGTTSATTFDQLQTEIGPILPRTLICMLCRIPPESTPCRRHCAYNSPGLQSMGTRVMTANRNSWRASLRLQVRSQLLRITSLFSFHQKALLPIGSQAPSRTSLDAYVGSCDAVALNPNGKGTDRRSPLALSDTHASGLVTLRNRVKRECVK